MVAAFYYWEPRFKKFLQRRSSKVLHLYYYVGFSLKQLNLGRESEHTREIGLRSWVTRYASIQLVCLRSMLPSGSRWVLRARTFLCRLSLMLKILAPLLVRYQYIKRAARLRIGPYQWCLVAWNSLKRGVVGQRCHLDLLARQRWLGQRATEQKLS